ncbi:DUF6491 family protein [Stakelama flava]|nr:DUF6491 family protein [Stakelama flava]
MMFALLLAFAPAQNAQSPVPVDKRPQVSIAFASNGGLRNWTRGTDDSSLYVQDSRLRWYYVRLSGPCLKYMTSMSIGYTTDSNGSFDRFSHVFDLSQPERVCGAESIVRSAKPPQYGGKGIAEPVSGT